MEVIRFGTPNSKPPLLFIHGAYTGAWVWTKYFLPTFDQAGLWGAAISLRGHGNSEGANRIDHFGVADYLADIDAGVKLFDQPPVLIGHSLGGFLIQKYALDHAVKGMVLLSSPSLLGLGGGSMQHVSLRSPVLALQLVALSTMGPANADVRVISAAHFSHPRDSKDVDWLSSKLQRESARFSFEASVPDFRRPKAQIPTFVLAGSDDAFVPGFEFRYQANFWGGEIKLLRGAAHGLMFDETWPEAAKEIISWLTRTYPA